MMTGSIAKFAGLGATLVAGVSMLGAAAAFAGEGASRQQIAAQDIEYGEGLVCRTQQQAEAFVAHLDHDSDDTAGAMNAGARDGDACGMATLAFLRGGELATVRTKNETFEIVQILVVGVGTPDGFRSVAPAVLVSLFKIDEYVA
jgi:hypothetical protein